MPTPFRELHNNSNASVSSYETAWSSSFSTRKSINNDSRLKQIKDEPQSDLDESISALENNISMMSVSSPISPAYRTPARKAMKESPATPMTPGDQMLEKVDNEEDKELLRQLYPEMFQEASQQPPKKPREIKKKLKIEPMTDDEDANKENRDPNGKEIRKTRSKKIVISSDSESEEEQDEAGNFDDYLKKFREEPAEPPRAERKARNQKNFVVDDDEDISEDESESEDSVDSENDLTDEEYREASPEVKEKSSKKKRPSDDEEWFLLSLSESFLGPVHDEAKVYVKEGSLRFKKNRESLLTRLQDILVRRIFSTIPSEKLVVTWNPRLRKSAGQCRNHSNGNSTVEMSPVVCTTAERVRDTLIHEMCHAAVWVVDRLHKEGHGPGWKRWGARCSSAFKSLPFIERCHSYEIEAKFFYVCENDGCDVEIKRQSKSLDTSRKACGRCLGRFILYRYCRRTNTRIKIEDPNRKAAAPAPKRSPSPPPIRRVVSKHPPGFKEFTEKYYWDYSNAGLNHSEVIEKLLKEFNALNKSE